MQSGVDQAVNATVKIVWEPQAAAVPLDPREIDFDGGPGGDFEFEDVKWCSGIGPGPDFDVNHPTDPRFPGDLLPWCLIDEHVKLLPGGMVQVTQVYDGAGDPMWR